MTEDRIESLKSMDRLWKDLILIKRKMIEGNMSFSEVKEQLIKEDSRYKVYLNRLEGGKLQEIFSVLEFIAYKEQFEAFLDSRSANDDPMLKELLEKTSRIDLFDLLSFIRNNASHHGDNIKLHRGRIYFKFGEEISMKSLKNKMRMAMGKGLLKDSEDCFNLLSRSYGSSKIVNIFREFSFKNVLPREKDGLIDKYMSIIISEKLNDYILNHQDVKWNDIIKKNKGLFRIPGHEIVVGKKKNKEINDRILAIDSILYAQFALSECLDDKFDYIGKISSLPKDGDVANTLGNIRNSIVHARLMFGGKETIKFFDLSERGKTVFKEIRRKKNAVGKHTRRDEVREESISDLQSALRDNPVNVRENLEEKITLTTQELIDLASDVVKINISELKKELEIEKIGE